MKEVLYAAERNFLERYLKEKASASLGDFKAASDLWGKPIPSPGTDAAVNEIYSISGDTAHIKIEGILSPEGPDFWDRFWGYNGASYKTIQAAMERAKNDLAVQRVIFDIDSPGGTAAGCDETYQAHKDLAAKKPTEVRAVNLLASAAYEIATPAHKILASGPSTRVGSIGVLVATYDWSKWEEERGIKEIIITSSNAPDKHPDVSTKHGRDTIKAQLDALERIFYAHISESRGVTAEHIAEHFGRGGLLVAQDPSAEHEDAIRAGMIDGLTADSITASDTDAENAPQAIGDPFECLKLFDEKLKNEAEMIKRDAQRYKETSPCGEKNTPATAGKTQEGQTMDLSELLKANPAAAAELDRVKAEAKAEGRKEARAEFQSLAVKCTAALEGKAYPEAVRVKACQALRGESSLDAFEAVQSAADMLIEQAKSQAAQGETVAIGGMNAEAPNLTPAAEKELDAAIKAELDKRKVA